MPRLLRAAAAAAAARLARARRGLATSIVPPPNRRPRSPQEQDVLKLPGGMVRGAGLSKAQAAHILLAGQPRPCAASRAASLLLLPLQALTRRNILVAAVGAAATVWLYDMLYEERVAQKVAEKRRDGPARVADV